MPNEIELLRNENEHLKNVINILAKKLSAINNIFSSNVIFDSEGKILISSDDDFYSRLQNNLHPTIENKVGIQNDLYSTTENKVGIQNDLYPTIENKVGITYIINTNRNSSETISNKDNSTEINTMLRANLEDGIANKTIDINRIILFRVISELRGNMNTCSRDSIIRAANILLELYQHPKSTLKQLEDLTGLSEGGINKHMASLKKRGLILKRENNSYELTAITNTIFVNAILENE